MKTKILETLGDNHKTPIHFNSVTSYTEVYGLYTYKGGVYVFKEGRDLDFEDLTQQEQKKVFELVESKNWKLNKHLQ
jgi:hypothetical protein